MSHELALFLQLYNGISWKRATGMYASSRVLVCWLDEAIPCWFQCPHTRLLCGVSVYTACDLAAIPVGVMWSVVKRLCPTCSLCNMIVYLL